MGLDELRNRRLKWMPDFLRKRGFWGRSRTVNLEGQIEHVHINWTSKQSTRTYYANTGK